jgi:hypothetical protein
MLLMRVEATALATPRRRGEKAARPPRLDDVAGNSSATAVGQDCVLDDERESRRRWKGSSSGRNRYLVAPRVRFWEAIVE